MSRPGMARWGHRKKVRGTPLSALAEAEPIVRQLRALEEQAGLGQQWTHLVIVFDLPYHEGGLGSGPAGPYRTACFVGSWSPDEKAAWLAGAATDPRFQDPPPGWTPQQPPRTEITLPNGGRLSLNTSEPARSRDGSPARALPPSRRST